MKICLLGSMRLVISAQTRLFTGITASLIGYLALQHSTGYAATRTRIAGTLWPTVDEDRARHLLSNALYRLRQQLGTAATHLVVTNETIALQDVWVDVTQFRQLGMETAVSEWQAAINLYTGDLLEELDHSWLLTLRAELQEQYLALLHRTCDALVTQNRTTDALLVAHRWTVADPLNETAHVNMIQLYAQLGRFAAAQHQYQTLVTLLTEELGLSPLPATTELVFSIQKERQHTDRQQQATQSHFIGRKQERAALITQLDQLLHARGGLIFVEGEPGMGKTRLVEELNAAATWRKINVAWGRANEMDASEWGTPLPAALQAATAGPRLHQLMPELTTTVRQLLAPFIPRLRTGDKTLLDFRNTSTSPKMQITIAIQKLLQALTQREPTLLIFDDVQWANTSFWQMLPGIMQVAQERPLLILLSYRSQTMQQDKIGWAMLQQLDQEHVPLRLELTGWDIAKCAELAAMQGKNLADADVTHLHRLSNGNPLVLNELLLHDGTHSPTFEALLSDRVSRLSANERGALTAVSVLGREFTHPIWQAMMDDPVPVTALLHQRFLTETMHGYSFQHDLVRAYLYQTLSPAQQQHWHQKAGDALAVAGTTNATLAWHYERAEQWGQAIHYHQHAVKRALLLGNYQAAREHNGRSLTLLTHHKIDEAEQLPLRLQRLQVLQIETWSSDNLAEADEIEALALQHDDQTTLLHLMLTKLNYFVQQGRMDELRIVGNRAIALAHELGDPSIEVQTRNQVAYKIGTVIRDTETAYTIAQQATALAETMPNEPHLLATTLLTMTVIHLINRDLQLGRDCLARADAIVANHAELASLEPEFIFYRAIIAQLSGDWETTRTLQYQLVDIHRRANDFSGLQAALYNVAHIAMFLGQFEEAILYAQELLHYVIAHSSEADKYLIYTYRAFLAECYAMVADFDAAEETIGPVLHWLETAESGRAVTYGWTVVGILRFYQGDLEGAYQAHGRVLELAKHKGSITTSPLITYAEVAHLLGHTEEAEQVFEQVKGLIKPGIVTGNTTYFHYVHFLITDDRSHLASAREVMFKLADGLTDPQLRQDYLNRLPLHKDIEQYWQQDQPSLMKATLVRADLPMGKSISPTDMVEVSWTVDAGASDTQVGQQAGKLALRRHRLQRLVTEARAQGAAPTHADLAIAVDVSVRTVERDGAALEKAGTPLLTRGYVPK